MAISVYPLPALKDNYIWVVLNDQNEAIIVDPSTGAPVLDYLEQNKLTPKAIFITHKHYDHTNGIGDILDRFSVPIYAPKNDPISYPAVLCDENMTIQLSGFETFKVLDLPAHTKGHIAFYTDHMVFTGDTLFSAGCGRIFEGTAQQMFDALNKLRHLPDTISVYCGHEYTVKNLQFAQLVEPDNEDVAVHLQLCKKQQKNHQPTLPSTIQLEKKINPFMRCHVERVKLKAEEHAMKTLNSPVEVLSVLRAWKDQS